MTDAVAVEESAAVGSQLQGTTLRADLEARRETHTPYSLAEAIAVVVPVILRLKEIHDRGELAYVHASCILMGAAGGAEYAPALATAPTHPLDHHLLAPELHASHRPGDATSTVYSLGALLYELLTCAHVGPGMLRPCEANPGLPESIEVLIGKAVIVDRAHRPGDLGALASALYHVAPSHSIHPPEMDDEELDASAELDVDIHFSLLPPPSLSPQPVLAGGDPFGNVVRASVPAPRVDELVQELSLLKQRLETDPRPRYVVVRDGIDHGPFTAVELLQQIASHRFVGTDILRDELGGESEPLTEWEEFAPFVEQAHLKRADDHQKSALHVAEKRDKKRGAMTFVVGAVVVLVAGGLVSAWLLRSRGTRSDEFEIQVDRGGGAVELSGGVGKRQQAKRTGGGGPGGPGAPGPGGAAAGKPGAPNANQAGGPSFEGFQENYQETVVMGKDDGPELTRAQLAGPLSNGAIVGQCGASDDMSVTVRVAVQNGRAQGVSVSTNPPNAAVAGCIAGWARGLSWPVSSKADFVTVSFK